LRKPLRLRRRDPRASPRRRVSQGALAELVQGQGALAHAANWGGQGLHPRGNFEGFVRAASKQKWLEAHGIEHWTHFYTDYGRQLQLRFFDHFLHGKKNGWDRAAERAAAGAPSSSNSWSARRTSGRSRAQVDQALSRSAGGTLQEKPRPQRR
jgi:hypothetical protein